MATYAVYAIMSASKLVGIYEAEDADEALKMAEGDGDWHANICHHCSGEIELGDVYDEQVDLIE